MPELSTIWFVLIGVLLAAYAILDGFDLGVGALHFFVGRSESERRTVLASIGPVWDGNEVWLLTAGGALFAAFPLVYATVFSGFYLALMLVLACLIVRAVSIEFRNKGTTRAWSLFWDVAFSLTSAIAVVLFGVAIGNVLRGLPLDPNGVYRGGLVGLLNPFSLAVGVVALALAIQHGAAWLVLKTDGPVQARARLAGAAGVALVVASLVVATIVAWFDAKRIWDNYSAVLSWAGPVLFGHACGFLAMSIYRRRDVRAFLFSTLAIVGLALTVGTSLWPNLVPAVEASRSLTVAGTASSQLTLQTMLVIALIGVPLVLLYTAFIYSRFRGKVHLEEEGGY